MQKAVADGARPGVHKAVADGGEAESEQWAAASNSWAQDAAPKKVPAPAATQQVLAVLTCSCVSGAGRGRQSAMVAYCT